MPPQAPPQNANPNATVQPPLLPQKKEVGMGPVVGTIIILILLVLGGLYFWGAKLNQQDTNPPPLILGNTTTPASGATQ